MKEYLKPEAEYVSFSAEPVTNGTADAEGDVISVPGGVGRG